MNRITGAQVIIPFSFVPKPGTPSLSTATTATSVLHLAVLDTDYDTFLAIQFCSTENAFVFIYSRERTLENKTIQKLNPLIRQFTEFKLKDLIPITQNC
jgi:lipocalin